MPGVKRTRTTTRRSSTKRRRVPRPVAHVAKQKFGMTKSLNYSGVGFRKEMLIGNIRFAWLAGVGTNDGIYATNYSVQALQPTNWAALKELYGQYQIRAFKVKLFPPLTNVEAQSTSQYEVPLLTTKKDCVENAVWTSLDEAAQSRAKSLQFTRPRTFYVQCKPEISLNATGDVKIPVDHRKTWIPTDNDSVRHRGLQMMLSNMDAVAWGQTTIQVPAHITIYYGFKQQK